MKTVNGNGLRLIKESAGKDFCERRLTELVGTCNDEKWELPREVPFELMSYIDEKLEELEKIDREVMPESELRALISRVLLHYDDAPDMTDEQAALVFEDYVEALNSYPARVVQGGCRICLSKRKYWPKVAHIVECCEDVQKMTATFKWRLKCLKRLQRLPLGAVYLRTERHDRVYRLSNGQEAYFHIITGLVTYPNMSA